MFDRDFRSSLVLFLAIPFLGTSAFVFPGETSQVVGGMGRYDIAGPLP